MVIDYTISVGAIINFIGLLCGGVAVFTSLRLNMTKAQGDITEIRATLVVIGNSLVQIARQDERIKSLENIQNARLRRERGLTS